MARKPAADARISARDKLAREKARSIADKYLPDPDAPKGSGPWAQWCLERIDELEAELDAAQAALTEARKAPPPRPEPKRLSDKEMEFAQQYVVDRNATQAAIRAGYSKKSAANIGYENVRKPHIAAVITELIKEQNQRIGWDPDKLLRRLAEEGDADVAELYDDRGCLLPVRDWPLVFRMGLVASIETNELWDGAGADRMLIGQVVKVKLVERTKIKELIGKHTDVQAFKERLEVDMRDPLARLYDQIAGTGIRPRTPELAAPGLGRPGLATIRPRQTKQIEGEAK